MKTANLPYASITENMDAISEGYAKELSDVQLALVGGGMGDVHVG